MCEPRCEIGTQASDKCVVKSAARKALVVDWEFDFF